MTRYANSRDTDAASELESFLDNESHNLSPHLFDGLEDVAESIDKIVNELIVELQDVQSDNEEHKAEINELYKKIEELEESK